MGNLINNSQYRFEDLPAILVKGLARQYPLIGFIKPPQLEASYQQGFVIELTKCGRSPLM